MAVDVESRLSRRGLLLGAGATASVALAGMYAGARWVFPGRWVSSRNGAAPAELLTRSAYVANPNWFSFAADASGATWLLVGSDGCVLRSGDEGSTFERASTPVSEALFSATALGDTPGFIVVGARGCVLRSDSEARHLTRCSSSTQATLRRVCLSRGTGELLAIGEGGTIIRSSDTGRSWRPENSNTTKNLGHLLELPGGRWLCCGEAGTLLRSHSPGQWDVAELPGGALITAAKHGPWGALILLGTESGAIHRSVHDLAFEQTLQLATDTHVTSFAVDSSGRVALAATNAGAVLCSRDSGQTWHALPTENRDYLAEVVFNVKAREFLLVGNRGALLTVNEQGTQLRSMHCETSPDILSVAASAQSGGYVLAGRGGWLARARSSEVTTQAPGVGVFMHSVAYEAHSDTLVAVGTHGGGARSQDGGFEWHPLSLPVRSSETLYAVHEHGPSKTLWIGGSGGVLLRSQDAGQSFQRVNVTTQSVCGFYSTQRCLMAFSLDEGILLSEDASRFRRAELLGQPSLLAACEATDGGLVCVGMRGAIYRSADGGQSWIGVESGTSADLRAIVREPFSSALWAVGSAGTVLKSVDQGRSFARVLAGTDRNLLALGAASGSMWMAGAQGALFSKAADSDDWQLVTTTISESLRWMGRDPKQGNLLVAGAGGSVLRLNAGVPPLPVFTHTSANISAGVYHPPSASFVLVGERLVRTAAAPA